MFLDFETIQQFESISVRACTPRVRVFENADDTLQRVLNLLDAANLIIGAL